MLFASDQNLKLAINGEIRLNWLHQFSPKVLRKGKVGLKPKTQSVSRKNLFIVGDYRHNIATTLFVISFLAIFNVFSLACYWFNGELSLFIKTGSEAIFCCVLFGFLAAC
ncbi:hypothetical protein [Symbiopectobacterium sp.]|uniref:hypothetical protein n=1 Tax=Symbiopectobacterium sp. TaxID=2952789 RepID=UPI003F687B3E